MRPNPSSLLATSIKAQPGTIPSVLGTFGHRKLALVVAGHFPMSVLRGITRQVLSE